MKQGSLLIILLTILNCTPVTSKKTPQFKLDSLQNWPLLYHENFGNLRTLQSKARISLESAQFATNFNISLIYTAPDTLFVQAEGPFGLDIGKIFIGRERFILYNQFNNQFISGSLDDEYYNTFLETELTFREIRNGFIGYTQLPDNIFLAEEKKGIFLAAVDGKKWRFTVNIGTGTLKTFEIIENNQVVFKQELLSYTESEGVIFPRFIRMILPQKKEMVAIYHKNIKINHPVDKNSYSIEVGPKTRQLIIN
jgi:hypothetical protein